MPARRSNFTCQRIATRVLLLTIFAFVASVGQAQLEDLCGTPRPYDASIELDDTGIASWDYLNPRLPRPLALPKQKDFERALESSKKAFEEELLEVYGGSSDDPIYTEISSALDDLCRSAWRLAAHQADVKIINVTSSRSIVVTAKFSLPEKSTGSTSKQNLTQEFTSFSEAQQQVRRTSIDGVWQKSVASLEDDDDNLERVRNTLQSSTKNVDRLIDDFRQQANQLVRSILESSTENRVLEVDCPGEVVKGKAGSCTLTLRPEPGLPVEINPVALALATGRQEFSVSFFDEESAPANRKGYVATSTKEVESESKTSWQTAVSIGGKLDPDTASEQDEDEDDKPDPFSDSNPYQGRELSRFDGSGRIDFTQTLGDRAAATVNIGFKSGDLGSGDDLDATVSGYTVDVYGLTGIQFRFGRYAISNPTSSLAINAKGDGFEFFYRGHSVAYLVKRESLGGKADFENDDSQLVIYQLKSHSFRDSSFLRTGRFYALAGEEKTKEQTYDYQTIGGEITFGKTYPERSDESRQYFSGSIAAYQSERDLRSQCDPTMGSDDCMESLLVEDGDGTSALLSLTWGELQKEVAGLTAKRSYTLVLGYGSGDDPDSKDTEGYIGEAAGYGGFGPIFGSFLGKYDEKTIGPVGLGMSNKQYLAARWVEDEPKFSPLAGIAGLLDLKSDIRDSKFLLNLHSYRFNEEVLGKRDGGMEIEAEFQVVVPKGVNVSLKYAKLFPGSALEPVFESDPSLLQASISLKLK